MGKGFIIIVFGLFLINLAIEISILNTIKKEEKKYTKLQRELLTKDSLNSIKEIKERDSLNSELVKISIKLNEVNKKLYYYQTKNKELTDYYNSNKITLPKY